MKKKISSLKELTPVPSTLHLKDPYGEPLFCAEDDLPITVTMLGINSKKFFTESFEASKRQADAGEAAETLDYKLTERARLVASQLLGWSHPSVFGEFSNEKAIEVFSDPTLGYLTEQIENHAAARENFFPK